MDNDPLIEAVAVALSNEQGSTTFLKMAQAALAALAEAGYAVVPVKMTKEMDAVWLEGDFGEPQDAWNALLAAALAGREP